MPNWSRTIEFGKKNHILLYNIYYYISNIFLTLTVLGSHFSVVWFSIFFLCFSFVISTQRYTTFLEQIAFKTPEFLESRKRQIVFSSQYPSVSFSGLFCFNRDDQIRSNYTFQLAAFHCILCHRRGFWCYWRPWVVDDLVLSVPLDWNDLHVH